MQPAFRLLDVAREDLLLAVEAEQLHVLLEQAQFEIGGIGLALQRSERAFLTGPADCVADLPTLVEGLREVDGVVLRPVGRIGPVGLAESLSEDDGLTGETAAQTDRKVGQPAGTGLLFADAGGILLQGIGLQAEALLHAQFEEPRHRQKERIALRGRGLLRSRGVLHGRGILHGGDIRGGWSALLGGEALCGGRPESRQAECEQQEVSICFPVHLVCA